MNFLSTASFLLDEEVPLNSTVTDYNTPGDEPQGVIQVWNRFNNTLSTASRASVQQDWQRLRYFRQLIRVLGASPVALPEAGKNSSEQLLDALLEFKPHQLGMSLIVDEDIEASLVLTSYWPEGTLHVEYFFHFPADEPVNTVVNFYNKPAVAEQVPVRQWGWHSPASEFQKKLREQLRNGQWPLAHGW